MTSAAGAGRSEGARLAGLDGLRGVAVICVLVYHYTVRWAPPLARETLYPYGRAFVGWPGLNYGWIGVELFFAVSGFVIFMSLEKSPSLASFAWRRVARLWPAMLVCSTLTMLAAPFGPAQWRVGPLSWLTSVLFIDPNLAGGVLHRSGLAWVDGVYWTLWIEVRFYVMAALVFALFRRRALEALCGIATVSCVAGLHGWNYPLRPLAWSLLLPSYLPYFVYGAAAWRLGREGAAVRASTLLILLASGAMVVVGGFVCFEMPAGDPLVFAGLNVALLSLVTLLALDAPVVRRLGARPLARLGEASYSLYLIHSVAGIALIGLLSKLAPWPLALCSVALGMIGLALLLHRYVEIPGKSLMLGVSRWATAARAVGSSPATRFRPRSGGRRPSPSTIVNG